MIDLKTANRRFYILELLSEDAGHWVSAPLIQRGLPLLSVVHDVPLGTVLADLRWLEQRAVVELNVDHQGTAAKITQVGDDVRSGRMRVEGIDRPALD
jgi:hypothetical protein